jgi:glutamine synthetase
MFESAAEALKYIADHGITMVDLKAVALSGQWMHVTVPARRFTQKHFEVGVGYDGSSGSGFSKVESGDIVAMPQPDTAFVDPFWTESTLSFLCDTVTADTKTPIASDPRNIARRAVAYMCSTGVADEAWVGPEFEFHVFDHVDVITEPYHCAIDIHSAEVETDGATTSIPAQGGYLRVPPSENLHDLRSEICLILEGMGVPVRYHHHEVGAPGQCEIEIDLGPLVRVADMTMLIKYVIKNTARRHGKLATFMPKPVFGEAGNGMHVHQKLHKGGENLFYDKQRKNYADLSDTALHYIAGLLTHGSALTGLTNPSTNSFKRLIDGYEAPVNLFFSLANRSAAIRVPRYAVSPEDKRIEYRPPDFTGNIYLTLAGMLMAGMDGIQSEIGLADNNFGPYEVDIAKQDPTFRDKITRLPNDLDSALVALRQDPEFLLKGEVFSTSLIEEWVTAKYEREVRAVFARPHPYEYRLYLDV